jgi:hypothetical protein
MQNELVIFVITVAAAARQRSPAFVDQPKLAPVGFIIILILSFGTPTELPIRPIDEYTP